LSSTLHVPSLHSSTTKKPLGDGASTLERTHAPTSGLMVAPALHVVAFIAVKAPLCITVKCRVVREGEK
jgi:hypothetical protein